MMNKTYILAVAALCAGAALQAQNLNPTVEVTRTYESKDLNINKGTVPMNVPDSLLRFDTDFLGKHRAVKVVPGPFADPDSCLTVAKD